MTYASLNFTTLLLMREKGMTLQEVAVYYALLVGISVSAGMYTSGRLIDRLAPRSQDRLCLSTGGGAGARHPVLRGLRLGAAAGRWRWLFLAVPMFLNYFYLSPAVALVQEEVRPNERVLAGALLLLVMNLMGLGLGPTFLGAVSDWFRPSHPAALAAAGFLHPGARSTCSPCCASCGWRAH